MAVFTWFKGTTGAIVEANRVCWLGMSEGTMYSGVLELGYWLLRARAPTVVAATSE